MKKNKVMMEMKKILPERKDVLKAMKAIRETLMRKGAVAEEN